MSDIPNLRQIDQATVDALCERVRPLAIDSYSVLQEANAFKVSRTPHDATRLANALQRYGPEGKSDGPIMELVADLDAAAEACAGVVPSNRHSTRIPRRGT